MILPEENKAKSLLGKMMGMCCRASGQILRDRFLARTGRRVKI